MDQEAKRVENEDSLGRGPNKDPMLGPNTALV